MKGFRLKVWLGRVAAISMVALMLPGSALAIEFGNFSLNGYLRQYLSWNLEDVPYAMGEADKHELSMARTTLLLQLRGDLGPARLTAIGRLSREVMTDYLDDLEDSSEFLGGDGDFKDEYNEEEIRELFVDVPVGERVNLRLGKQQVVWGETDFFQAMDVVHGYDHRWRSFLEPENEERRKPLILANAEIDIPELAGTLQLLARPGLDDREDIGNTYDMFGGRWAQNGSKGFDLNARKGFFPSFPFDYHHSDGDTDDWHYGGRWTGEFMDQTYTLNYYHTQAQDPVLYSSSSGTEDSFGLAFIYPEIDVYGGTLSGYIPAIDSVYRLEAAFVPDQPFNDNFGMLVKKDTVRTMLGLDTNMRLQNYIGTSGPGMVSLQIFDTWIRDYSESDMITNAFGTLEEEHTTWTTAILTFPYKNDTIIGQLVAVNDISNGGGVVVPSVEFHYGEHWRLKLEMDLFYGGDKDDGPGNNSLFGSFHNNDQFYARLTYQF